MLGTRYEEYTKFDNDLPFVFSKDITKTPLTYSHEANWHENLEIQLCTEGGGVVLMDEKKYNVVKNDIIVVNTNVIHHTNTSDIIKYDCLIIDTKFCRQIDIDPALLNFETHFKSEEFLKLFDMLKEVYSAKEDVLRKAKLNKVILQILIELRQNHIVAENKSTLKKRSFDAIKKTIKFIRSNYNKKMSLNEISANAYMDKYTLSKEFKKITNQTVVGYINSYRCKKAAEYISDGMTVSDAARMCGFTNMSFFTKTFKLYMRCLPSEYKQNKKDLS